MKITLKKIVELIVFSSRWILLGTILNLIVALILLVYKAAIVRHVSTDDIISVLEDVDIAMLANLVKSIITGSYNSFVSKDHGYTGENVSSGILKVKMGSSLIGISSIYLLRVFLSVDKNTRWDMIWMLVVIHCTFLLSSLVLALIEYLHCKTEIHEPVKASKERGTIGFSVHGSAELYKPQDSKDT